MALRERKISDLVLGLGFGVAAGCLIGVLYAPQSGPEDRRQMVSAMEEGADQVKSTAEDTGNTSARKRRAYRPELTSCWIAGKPRSRMAKPRLNPQWRRVLTSTVRLGADGAEPTSQSGPASGTLVFLRPEGAKMLSEWIMGEHHRLQHRRGVARTVFTKRRFSRRYGPRG